MRAAFHAESRALAQGLAATVLTPEGSDFNDDLATFGPQAPLARLAPFLGPASPVALRLWTDALTATAVRRRDGNRRRAKSELYGKARRAIRHGTTVRWSTAGPGARVGRRRPCLSSRWSATSPIRSS